MAENWLDDVRKYDSSADETVVGGIVRYCGISLRNRDSSMVSFSDATETGRVRDNFLRKKLALTGSDDELNQGLEAVKQQLAGDRTKNRVTVYYLLAKHFDKLGMFAGKAGGATIAASSAAGAAGLAGSAAATTSDEGVAASEPVAGTADEPAVQTGGKRAAAIGAAGLASATAAAAAAADRTEAALGDGDSTTPASRDTTTDRLGADAPRDRERIADVDDRGTGGGAGGWPSWLTWLLIGAAVIGIVLLLRGCGTHDNAATSSDTTNTAAVAPVENNLAAPAANVAEAPAPAGAGVVSSTTDGKPITNVYFDTAKSAVSPDFAAAAAKLKSYLAANPGAKLMVSGYNDPTGNATANAALSKSRAENVAAALASAGIAKDAVELVKPAQTTMTNVTPDQARRVEITVK